MPVTIGLSGTLFGNYSTTNDITPVFQVFPVPPFPIGVGAGWRRPFLFLPGLRRLKQGWCGNGRTPNCTHDSLNGSSAVDRTARIAADLWAQCISGGGIDSYENLQTINSTQCSNPILDPTSTSTTK